MRLRKSFRYCETGSSESEKSLSEKNEKLESLDGELAIKEAVIENQVGELADATSKNNELDEMNARQRFRLKNFEEHVRELKVRHERTRQKLKT